ncbi:MAG: hypothetical protein P9L94_04100 [Candidatus Hinthialibacter antarcticus]|nr:hypothetical protein [Candidatus Hinthialibacter antarcticus]
MDNNRTTTLRTLCFILFSGAVCCLSFISCQHAAPPNKLQPAVEPLSFHPIEYFEFNCARCHGSYGSSYGDTFGEGMTDAELIEFVDDMAAGPGQAPIEGAELNAQVAFHRSLVKDLPFIAWTGWDGETLSGEVTAGSSVTVKVGNEILDATVRDEKWSLNSTQLKPILGSLVITAERNGATSQLKLSESAFNHASELPQ